MTDRSFGLDVGLERVRYINEEEFGQLMRACRKHRLAFWAFYTLANLGLRVGELVTIQPQQLHPDREEFEVATLKQKRQVVDVVPCPKTVLLKILAYAREEKIKPGKPIFPYSERWIQSLWYRFAKRAKIHSPGRNGRRGRGIHCLRHFKGFHAKSRGADLKTVAVLLRHRSLGSTMKYWHTEELREMVSSIGEVTWDEKAAPKPSSSGKSSGASAARSAPRKKKRGRS